MENSFRHAIEWTKFHLIYCKFNETNLHSKKGFSTAPTALFHLIVLIDEYVPYWIAGDDAYGCTEKLSHPSRMISSDTFNFYHSGCNRIYIECAFGYSTMGNSMEILGDVFRELNNAMIKWSVCFFTTFVRDVAFLKMLWVYLQKKLMLLDSPPVVHLQSLYESGRRRPEINRRSWALQLVVACLLLDNSINKNTTT